jgi:conjugative transfer signal peptidase TraF
MTVLRPTIVLTMLMLGVVLLAASTLPLSRRIIYNPTPSAPLGWYAINHAEALHVHDFVLARIPDDATTLADERRYLSRGVPILKEIGAREGQTVCVADGTVSIDGMTMAHARLRDGAGRALTAWNGCRLLAAGELFLLSRSSEASFDSRYFGPIERDAVIGKATPVWTW